MEANNEYELWNWISKINDGSLRLPRFQREYVWDHHKTEKLLETIILKKDTPIGVFLVLETDSSRPIFESRSFPGAPDTSGRCRELLLDGQQRLTAIWMALRNMDLHNKVGYRYYVEFDRNSYQSTSIVKVRKDTKADRNRSSKSQNEFKKNWFPVSLLNPFEDKEIVANWIECLTLEQSEKVKVEKMIRDVRKIFEKDSGRVIPCFLLPSTTEKQEAIQTYRTLNSNSVKLSDYYLAIAEMERSTEESLYDTQDRLKKKHKEIMDLETDEVGELILKIFCLIEGKIPSGSAYKNLPYEELPSKEKKIFDGVRWTIDKLADLKIWDGKQLPTVVPLRVLPALYVECGGIKETTSVKKVIQKYLWHAFLTDRYSKQANQRLKEDFDDLKGFIERTKAERDIRIFDDKEVRRIDDNDISKAGWPQEGSKSIISRGILLVCCAGGAETLKDGVSLGKSNLEKRERHHIFPKSRIGPKGNVVINCMLIPEEENRTFKNELPGDYIRKLFESVGSPLPQVDVVARLATHSIFEDIARKLVQINTSNTDEESLNDEFGDFVEKRSGWVKRRIDELLANGE